MSGDGFGARIISSSYVYIIKYLSFSYIQESTVGETNNNKFDPSCYPTKISTIQTCPNPFAEKVCINTQSFCAPSSPFFYSLCEKRESLPKMTSVIEDHQLVQDGSNNYVFVLLPVKNDAVHDNDEPNALPDKHTIVADEHKSRQYSASSINYFNQKTNPRYIRKRLKNTENAINKDNEKQFCQREKTVQTSKTNKKTKKSKVKYFLTPGESHDIKGSSSIQNISTENMRHEEIKSPGKFFVDDNLTSDIIMNDINNNSSSGDMEFNFKQPFDKDESCRFSHEETISNDSFGFNEIVSKRTLREKMLPPEIRGKRRQAANARERKRVNKITDAFERLREHVPHLIKDRKLSKFETLQMAMAYIDALDKGLRVNTSSGLESTPLSNAAARARVVVAQSSAKWRLQRWLENKLGMSKKI